MYAKEVETMEAVKYMVTKVGKDINKNNKKWESEKPEMYKQNLTLHKRITELVVV